MSGGLPLQSSTKIPRPIPPATTGSCCIFGPYPTAALVTPALNATLVSIGVYILAQLGIGAYVSRRIRTETDYLLAGRSLGYGLGTFTIFATWFGAETCIGSAGAIYERGLSGGHGDPFGYGLCILLMGALLARPLWKRGLTTLADLFAQRYGAGVEKLAVLLMIPSSVLWAGAQVRAFGQVIATASGFDVAWAITFAATVVILYTVWGGLLADAWTDLIQGAVLLAGLALLLVAVWRGGGAAHFAAIEPARFDPFAGRSFLENAEAWLIPICGSVVAAELVARVIACKSPQVAQRSALGAAGLYLAAGLIPATLGLIGYHMLPGLEDPEQVLPLLAQAYLPGVLYIVFVGALVSAILSTVDSALLVAGSLLSHNVIVPLVRLDERQKVRAARWSVVGFGLLAYVLALAAEGVYDLVIEASAFGSAGLFITVVLALFTRWGGALAAAAALIAGVAAWIALAYVLEVPYPYLGSLAAAGAAYAGGAVLDTWRIPNTLRDMPG